MNKIFLVSAVRKLLRISLFLVPSAFVLILALSNIFILKKAHAYVYHSIKDIPPRSAIIVLGARVYPNGALSPMLKDRMQTALEVYRQGKADRFLVSGDHGRTNYDEVNAMKDFLLHEGVEVKDIFLDHAGFDTYDSMYRAKTIFEVRSAIIVTQKFHLARAVSTARAMGIDAVGMPADKQPYAGIAYNKAREVPARCKAFFRIAFHAKPKYLGDVIPITGDALKSWDRL